MLGRRLPPGRGSEATAFAVSREAGAAGEPVREPAGPVQSTGMEIGIYTFAELGPGADPARRLRDLLEEIVLADEVGLDVFGLGEHHRPDFAVSAPAVVLGAAAARDEADPADERGHRPQLGRPRARLSGLRDHRSALGRSRRDHGRPRLVHRVVPALRLRPPRVRRALRREARAAAEAPRELTGDVERQAPARRSTGSASTRGRSSTRLPVWVAVGGNPAVGNPRGPLGLPMALAIIGGSPSGSRRSRSSIARRRAPPGMSRRRR